MSVCSGLCGLPPPLRLLVFILSPPSVHQGARFATPRSRSPWVQGEGRPLPPARHTHTDAGRYQLFRDKAGLQMLSYPCVTPSAVFCKHRVKAQEFWNRKQCSPLMMDPKQRLLNLAAGKEGLPPALMPEYPHRVGLAQEASVGPQCARAFQTQSQEPRPGHKCLKHKCLSGWVTWVTGSQSAISGQGMMILPW